MRIIPEDNLAYPVLIKLGSGGTGSGFSLKTDEKAFLVTAKHVLFNEKGALRSETISLVLQNKDVNDDSTTIYAVDLLKSKLLKHKSADVAVVEIGSIKDNPKTGGFSLVYGEGVEALQQGLTGTIFVNANTATKELQDVLISNDVFLYGYPGSLGLKDSPQFDYNKPLLRKGVVANVYKAAGTIIIDCPAYYGNSGGPVVEVEIVSTPQGLAFSHKVIGVVSQLIPFVEEWENKRSKQVNVEVSNSGYSVAVAMDKVFELIGYKKSS